MIFFFFIVVIERIKDVDDRLLFLFCDICPIIYAELLCSETTIPLFMSGFSQLSRDLGEFFLHLCVTSVLLHSRC